MVDTDILFALVVSACFLWSVFYFVFAGHYFMATVIDSAAGIREVVYRADGIIDRLWRPGLCLWILVFWTLIFSIFLGPVMAAFPVVFAVVASVLLWILFPTSMLSVLYSQNWVFMVHPKLIWQKVQHFRAFAYVHVITLMLAAAAGVLIALVLLHSFYWSMPASFILPVLLLLYARHWGRFAWLAFYEERPRKKKKKSDPPMDEATLREILADDAAPEMEVEELDPEEAAAPEMEVEEFDPEVVGIGEGLPPTFPTAVHAGPTDAIPVAVFAGPADDPEVLPLAAPSVAQETFAIEEEDEFAKDKKPYMVIEPPSPGMDENLTISVADSKPGALAEYYDEQHREEKEKKRRQATENRFGPSTKGVVPTFETALLRGVWEFLFYPSTLSAWAILIALTIVELFFITMVVRNWPANNAG